MNKKIKIVMLGVCILSNTVFGALFYRQVDHDKAMALSRKNKKGRSVSQCDRDLRDSRLNEAILCGVNFRNANLRRAHFRRAKLRGATFEGANLKLSNLIDADLSEVNFTDANLNWTRLNGANLNGATFLRTNLKGIRWKGANLKNTIGMDELVKREAKKGGALNVPMRSLFKS